MSLFLLSSIVRSGGRVILLKAPVQLPLEVERRVA